MENNIRPPKELLQVFLDNQKIFAYGLCTWSVRLKTLGLITQEEEDYIDRLLEEDEDYNPFYFMWEKGKIEPRIDWLKENLK